MNSKMKSVVKGIMAGLVTTARMPQVKEPVEQWETLFEREMNFDDERTDETYGTYYGASLDVGYYPLEGWVGYPVRITVDDESKIYMLQDGDYWPVCAGYYSYIGDTEFNIYFHWLSDSGDFWDKRIVFYGAFTGIHNVRIELKTSAKLAGYQYNRYYTVTEGYPVFPALPAHNESALPYAILWKTADGNYYLTLSASSIDGSFTENGNDEVFRWLQSGVALQRYEVVNDKWELQSETVTTDELITDYWHWYNHDWTFTDWLWDDPSTYEYSACYDPIPVYE